MIQEHAKRLSVRRLSPIAAALYEWSLRHGRVSRVDVPQLSTTLEAAVADVDAGLAELIELSLLRQGVDQPESLVPVSPESAAAVMVNPIESEIKAMERHAEDLKAQFLTLIPLYFDSRQDRNRRDAVDVLPDTAQVRSALGEAGRRCSAEVFSAYPGVFSPSAIETSHSADLDMLNRGVRMRSLYQHPVRVNKLMRDLLDELGTAGCAVRTCEEISSPIVIFDREVAFIPNPAGPSGAVVIREPSIVDFLHRGLELAWSTAVPYADNAAALGYGAAGSELRRAIVRMLAMGAKDELIARRLSVSLRTCRRHIAEIMEELDASSRFQAGVAAVRSGLVSASVANEVKQSASALVADPAS